MEPEEIRPARFPFEPFEGEPDRLAGFALDVPWIYALKIPEVEMVVIDVKTLIQTPDAVQNVGADEGRGLVSVFAQNAGERRETLPETRRSEISDSVGGRVGARQDG